MKKLYLKGTIFLVLCLIVTTLTSCQSSTTKSSFDGFQVSYIDVGQGDSIFIQCKGESMLIDSGENDCGNTVADYIKSAGTTKLKYAVGTHPHSDHIGGMDTVMEEIPADYFICPEIDYDTKTWDDVLDVVEDNDTQLIYAQRGKSYTLGSATFTILSPDKNAIYSDCNNYSVVIRAEYGKTSFLFIGDGEKVVEDEMINNDCKLKSDVLKVGHHGSTSSTTQAFLDKVKPKYAVISCGKDNKYGHPHEETLQKLNDMGVTIHRTDEEGTVVAQSDGKSISFVNAPKQSAKETFSNPDATKSSPTVATTQSEEEQEEVYIGNKNSKKLHKKSCSAVSAMSEKNKVYFYNRKDALVQGYSPCNNCNP
ncbi:MAG: ComEC/Rec2 family competence protein [Ruminococcus sp.]